MDALGRRRGIGGFGGGHDETEQTVNQVLAELDGFDPREGIVLLAATDRPEILDPALMRAGWFDRQVVVDRPDKTGQAAILRVHPRKVAVNPALDVDEAAGLTPFTGAELATLGNEAAIHAKQDRGGFLGDDRASFSPRDHSEAAAREVDLAICGLPDVALKRATGLLAACHADLAAGAALLMARETITPAEFPPLIPQEVAA